MKCGPHIVNVGIGTGTRVERRRPVGSAAPGPPQLKTEARPFSSVRSTCPSTTMAPSTRLSALSRQVFLTSRTRISIPQVLSPRRTLSTQSRVTPVERRWQRCPARMPTTTLRSFSVSASSRAASALAFAEPEEPSVEEDVNLNANDEGTLPANRLRNIAIIAHGESLSQILVCN